MVHLDVRHPDIIATRPESPKVIPNQISEEHIFFRYSFLQDSCSYDDAVQLLFSFLIWLWILIKDMVMTNAAAAMLIDPMVRATVDVLIGVVIGRILNLPPGLYLDFSIPSARKNMMLAIFNIKNKYAIIR